MGGLSGPVISVGFDFKLRGSRPKRKLQKFLDGSSGKSVDEKRCHPSRNPPRRPPLVSKAMGKPEKKKKTLKRPASTTHH